MRSLKDVGWWSRSHACLDSSAKLKISKSLKPRPPRCLGFIISSQETQLGLRFPCLLPHQNCLIKEVTLSHKPLGRRKHDIENTGIDYATDLISTSFPAADNIFSIQPLIFSHTRSLKYLKVPFFECPTSVGIPKYLSLRDSFWTFRVVLMLSLMPCGHPPLKKIDDFS